MTMRRIAVLLAILFLAGTVSGRAGKKKQKTGVVTGNVYVDNLHGFSFTALDNWKFSGAKKENPEKPKRERFTLVQKNYQIPPNRRDNQEEFTPPTVVLWVDTCSLSVDSFSVLMADRGRKSKARKSLAGSFTIMRQGQFVEQEPIQIDGADGVVQKYRLEYETQLYDRVHDAYSFIEEILLGDLYIVKNQGCVYAFGFRAERLNYRVVREEVMKMILTMDFDPADSDSTTGGDVAGEDGE